MKYEEVETNSERWFDLTPLLNEEFRDIKGYEGLYQVSNYGRIKSLLITYYNVKNKKKEIIIKSKILKSVYKNKNGNSYLIVGLHKNEKQKYYYIHRLVAQAFLKRKKYQNQINHKDGIKSNNKINNLEWCDNSENQLHALKIGLKKPAKGLQCGNIRKISQYSKNMIFIRNWDYIALASEQLNIPASNIIRCCRNQIPSAGGYIWKYLD